MNFRPASFKAHFVHVRFHELDAAPMLGSGVGHDPRYLFEVESFSLIRHDDGYFPAGLAAAADVYLCILIFLISVHHGVFQRFPERQLDVELFSRYTVRSFNQSHQAIHEWRDRSNLAGHPRINSEGGGTRAFFWEPQLRICRSIQASHSTHGQRLTLRGNASQGPKRGRVPRLWNLLI